MCKKKQFQYCPSEIDECIKDFIRNITQGCDGTYEILACCCGHNRYPMTIVVKNKRGQIFDLVSNKDIPRIKKYYKRDSKGYYYIPEVSKEKKWK